MSYRTMALAVTVTLPAVGLLGVSPACAQAPTAAGIWGKVEDGKPVGWFRIIEKTGTFEGQIVKMFPKPGEDPASWRCTKCEGTQKDAPVLGITFIKSMKRKGLAYEDGKILDPRDGNQYKARMDLSPDGKELAVRGYIGVALLGRTETWHRLPDSALSGMTTGSVNRSTRAPSR